MSASGGELHRQLRPATQLPWPANRINAPNVELNCGRSVQEKIAQVPRFHLHMATKDGVARLQQREQLLETIARE